MQEFQLGLFLITQKMGQILTIRKLSPA